MARSSQLGRAFGLVIGLGPACVLNNLKYDDDASASATSGSSTTIAGTTIDPSATTTSTSGASEASTSGSASASATSTATTTTDTSEATSEGSTTAVTSEASTGESDTSSTTGGCERLAPGFLDKDEDGFGDAEVLGCAGEPGFAEVGGDCDDTNQDAYPGAPELCDGVDNNCNFLVDEADAALTQCDQSGSLCHLAAFEGHFYYACNGPLKPSEAHAKCQTFAVGGAAQAFHVKVESDGENGVLKGLVPKLGGDTSIGLTADPNSTGAQIEHYHWIIDDTPIGLFGATKGADPWESGQPGLDIPAERWIVIRGGNLGWNNTDDDTPLPFLCEAIPG